MKNENEFLKYLENHKYWYETKGEFILYKNDKFYGLYDPYNKEFLVDADNLPKDVIENAIIKNSFSKCIYNINKKGDNSYISIYNYQDKKFLINDYLVTWNVNNFLVIKNPLNEKYMIIGEKYKEERLFEFDQVEPLNSTALVVTLENKKGLYLKNKGLKSLIIYDDIYLISDTIAVLEKDNLKYFCVLDSDKDISMGFDKIYENEEPNIIYAQREDETYVFLIGYYFYRNISELIFLLKIRCEELSNCIFKRVEDSVHYYFIFKKDGKYGLIFSMAPIFNPYGIETHVQSRPIYDKIEFNELSESFILEKDNLFELYVPNEYHKKLYGSYERIVSLNLNAFLLFKDNSWSIYYKNSHYVYGDDFITLGIIKEILQVKNTFHIIYGEEFLGDLALNDYTILYNLKPQFQDIEIYNDIIIIATKDNEKRALGDCFVEIPLTSLDDYEKMDVSNEKSLILKKEVNDAN